MNRMHPRFVEAIKYLHPSANFATDVILEDHGDGPTLVAWPFDVPPPSDEEVAALVPALDAANAPTFLAQDMLALLTDADCSAIQQAITGNSSLWRMWQSLVAQRDPISTDSDRFRQGWGGLKAVLGDMRCSLLASQLGIPNG